MRGLTGFPKRCLIVVCVLLAAVVVTGVALAVTFTNAGAILITDAAPKPTKATPYPSAIAVSGLAGTITDVNVTLNGLTHSAPDDIDVLVTSPGGGKVLVMSDAGDTFPVSQAINLTFDDSASSSLPDSTTLSGGTYKPTNHGSTGADDPFCVGEPDETTASFPATAPAAPYSSALSAFQGQVANGTWNIYVTDDCAGGTGSFASGWTLDITMGPTAVTVAGLTSRPVNGGVRVHWRTSVETQIVGFNVYRGNAKLNKRLISARHAGVARGGAYSLVDRKVRKGGTYTYRLQVVGLDGKRSWFGATSIQLKN